MSRTLVAAVFCLQALGPLQAVPPGNESVVYHDKNSDGKVDEEFHHIPGTFDLDWELVDTDHDGIYDQKITYGYSVEKTKVSVPVPVAGTVKISK